MIRKYFIAFFILLAIKPSIASLACTIFIANDGRQVWVGNNEDEAPSTRYRFWYYPTEKKDFGYMLWTELTDQEEINKIIYKNPQGGINTYGLFMDYTAIDEIPFKSSAQKKDREEQVVTDILKQCKTVQEALKYIEQFNLIRLTSAQLFIADASGDYATVHGSYIVRKTTSNFALTNYSINNHHVEACWRRAIAQEYLSKTKPFYLSDVTDILKKTTQKPPSNLISNYSMAWNLKNTTLHLYYKNDFSTPVAISLSAELKKGVHYKDMIAYFPASITDTISKKYNTEGISAAINTYNQLRKNYPTKYNFKNNDGINLAAQAIANGQEKDAIKFLECLRSFDPNKTDIDAWLGIAYRHNGELEKSKQCFTRVLNHNVNNYLANLFGRQQDQKITFKMNDFEGAESVALAGSFSDWKPIKMKKINDVWHCEIIVPRGEYRYKFIVNKDYLADQINLMHAGSGPDIYSILYVW